MRCMGLASAFGLMFAILIALLLGAQLLTLQTTSTNFAGTIGLIWDQLGGIVLILSAFLGVSAATAAVIAAIRSWG